MKKIIISLLLIAICGSAVWLSKDRLWVEEGSQLNYQTAIVEERDILRSVTAIGEVSAVTTVEVGSEVSGQIKEILVDYNSQVEAGQVVARIDPEGYETLLRQGQAELAMCQAQLQTEKTRILSYQAELQSAEANLIAVQAGIKKATVILENAKRDQERQKALLDREFISKNEYDDTKSIYEEAVAELEQQMAEEIKSRSGVESAKANLAVAKSQIKEAEANVELKIAALDNRKVDLENTIIRSPVNGVVIDRSVDVGQTVAASLQTPTLFTIAQDLRKMQVTASVDEADIGQIKEGQPAVFTVDAFSDRKFKGQVTQIRKQGITVENVVTYEVIVSADNSNQRLLPGMTADVSIEILKKDNVTAVPNSALRFKPIEMQSASGSSLQAASVSRSQGSLGNDNPRRSPGGQSRIDEKIKEYSDKLDLSPSQQSELKKILGEASQKMKKDRENKGLIVGGPGRDVKNAREKARKESQAAILRILDGRQKSLFEKMAEHSKSQLGTLWQLNDKGQPESRIVRLGESDGSFTEVLGKGVEKGMEIIVGYQY